MGHDRHGIFLCVPENRSRPIVVKKKKKKIGYWKIKNKVQDQHKTWTNPQIKKCKKNELTDWSDHGYDTKIYNTYLNS